VALLATAQAQLARCGVDQFPPDRDRCAGRPDCHLAAFPQIPQLRPQVALPGLSSPLRGVAAGALQALGGITPLRGRVAPRDLRAIGCILGRLTDHRRDLLAAFGNRLGHVRLEYPIDERPDVCGELIGRADSCARHVGSSLKLELDGVHVVCHRAALYSGA
jgi:hypothetical protein